MLTSARACAVQGARPRRCAAHREAGQVCLTSKPSKLCQFRESTAGISGKRTADGGGSTERGDARRSKKSSSNPHCMARATHGTYGTPVSEILLRFRFFVMRRLRGFCGYRTVEVRFIQSCPMLMSGILFFPPRRGNRWQINCAAHAAPNHTRVLGPRCTFAGREGEGACTKTPSYGPATTRARLR